MTPLETLAQASSDAAWERGTAAPLHWYTQQHPLTEGMWETWFPDDPRFNWRA